MKYSSSSKRPSVDLKSQVENQTDFIRDNQASTTLEFALSLFLFLVIGLTITQVVFLLHARLIVQYAATCACRSAVVWIPAETDNEPDKGIQAEVMNQLNKYESTEDDDAQTRSQKMFHIKSAAAIACIPLAPTSLEKGNSSAEGMFEDLVKQASLGLSSSFPLRLGRKWISANRLTKVSIKPPESGDRYGEHELIKVAVTHSYYLDIPGPFTVIKDHVDITDMVALPNNGEVAFPSAEGGLGEE